MLHEGEDIVRYPDLKLAAWCDTCELYTWPPENTCPGDCDEDDPFLKWTWVCDQCFGGYGSKQDFNEHICWDWE